MPGWHGEVELQAPAAAVGGGLAWEQVLVKSQGLVSGVAAMRGAWRGRPLALGAVAPGDDDALEVKMAAVGNCAPMATNEGAEVVGVGYPHHHWCCPHSSAACCWRPFLAMCSSCVVAAMPQSGLSCLMKWHWHHH